MPLTPAHAAAAWPISRVLRRLPLDELVLGTLSPDFQYFFSLAPRGRVGHTLVGLVIFCVPVGLLAWRAYRAFVRRVMLSLLPAALRSHDGGAPPRIALVIAAIVVGAASHDLWDSFTHGSGWMVKHVAALSVPVPIGPQTSVRGYNLSHC